MSLRRSKNKPVKKSAEESVQVAESIENVEGADIPSVSMPMRRSRQIKSGPKKQETPESFFNDPAVDRVPTEEDAAEGVVEDSENGKDVPGPAGIMSSSEGGGLFSFTEEKKFVDLSQDDFELEIEDEEDAPEEEEPAEEPVEEHIEESAKELSYWTKRMPHSVKAALEGAAALYRKTAVAIPGDSLQAETEDDEPLEVSDEGIFSLPSIRVYEGELPAGWDSNLEVKLQTGECAMIDTGVKIAVPQGLYLEVIGCEDMLSKYGLLCIKEGSVHSSGDLGTNVCAVVEAASDLAYIPRYKSILRARLRRS